MTHSHFDKDDKELDSGNGMKLYYYGARYYDANLGRFISPDPVREYYNLYAYCGNNPIALLDPTGKGWVAFQLNYTPFTIGLARNWKDSSYHLFIGASVGNSCFSMTSSPSDLSYGWTIEGNIAYGALHGAGYGEGGLYYEAGVAIGLGPNVSAYFMFSGDEINGYHPDAWATESYYPYNAW